MHFSHYRYFYRINFIYFSNYRYLPLFFTILTITDYFKSSFAFRMLMDIYVRIVVGIYELG